MDIRSLAFVFCVLSGILLVEGNYRIGNWMAHEYLQGMLPSTSIKNITELSTRTLIFCLAACQPNNSCVSAFYNKLSHMCYLHDHVRTNTRLMISDVNGVYYVRNADYPACFMGDYETQYNTVKLDDGRLFTYRMPALRLVYEDAVAYCEADSASLIHVSTAALSEWLKANIDTVCIDPPKTLVDATNMFAADFYNLSQWFSSDNLALNAAYWTVDEPHYPQNKHCTLAEKGKYLKSNSCANSADFMCEM